MIKMILKYLKNILLVGIVSGLLFACSKEQEDTPDTITDLSDGVFVINEGPYNTGTGTISFFKRDGSYIQHKLYQNANTLIPLGNIVQSMTVIDDIAYIAVNNSNKVELASGKTFKSAGTIQDIEYPTYIAGVGNSKVYISSWDNTIKIIDTKSFEIVGQVTVGTGPTKMAVFNELVWVLNQGGLSVDSTVSVIDSNTGQVIKTIQVYPRPTGIQKDKNGKVWILCSGKGYWHNGATKGHLVCINPVDYSVQNDFIFPDTVNHPEKLVINNTGDVLYYNYPGGVYQFDINTSSLETSPLIARSGMFYSLGFDPKESIIYVSDPVDYVQPGWVFRYDALTGITIDSLKAGIVPAEYLFIE